MDSSYDIVVVGAGLAGAFAAAGLADAMRVVVLDKDDIGAGATGAAAGLVNPFMARKANPVWRAEEAVMALEKTLAKIQRPELWRRSGLLRPARDANQAAWFSATARDNPGWCSWLSTAQVAERWPSVLADFGALHVTRAGSLDLVLLAEALLDAAERSGCEYHTETGALALREDGDRVVVETDWGDIEARRVVLCVGADYADWPQLARLDLHSLKGQTIVVERPRGLGSGLPCLSGPGYVVPYPDELVLGSTYHHEFEHREPTEEDTREILGKAREVLPGLGSPRVLSVAAGVRVTVPGTRLPMIGPVTDSGRVWVYTGLGSKGLLMGALVGTAILDYLRDPSLIPLELRPRVANI